MKEQAEVEGGRRGEGKREVENIRGGAAVIVIEFVCI